MALVITRRMQINDIDAAGIAFTGRLVTIAMEGMEEGLARSGMDFAAIIRAGSFGFPIVHLEADFKRPFRHGDTVDVRISCDGIGDRSYVIKAELRPTGSETPSATLRFTAAVIDMATFKATAVPDAFRSALTALMD